MAVNLFLVANRSQRSAQAQLRVQADARFTLETIAREIRASVPDYALYADPHADGTATDDAISLTQATHVLALRDSTNAQTVFRQASTTSDPWAGGGAKLEICSTDCENTNAWSDITPPGVTLVHFEVFITPSANPFLLYGLCSTGANALCRSDSECDGSVGSCTDITEYRVNEQPVVTAILTLREEAQAGSPTAPNQVYQTTVTSRLFLR